VFLELTGHRGAERDGAARLVLEPSVNDAGLIDERARADCIADVLHV
jgi:hypothetical protein